MINANSNNVNAQGPQLAADNRCPGLEKEEREMSLMNTLFST